MSELVQYQLEFVINTSPKVLYSRLSSPAGLSEWFADDVNVRGEVFTFIWEDSEEKAKIIAKKENVFIKFQWISKSDEKAFLEFRIQSEELTGGVSLVITDYAESEERTDAIDLWEKQIAYLKHTLGILN